MRTLALLTPSRMIKALLCCASGVVLSACASQTISPPINGTVRDAQTKKPIASAIVTVYRAQYSVASRTNSDGSYSLPPITLSPFARWEQQERQWPPLFVTAWKPLFFADQDSLTAGYIPQPDPFAGPSPVRFDFDLKMLPLGL